MKLKKILSVVAAMAIVASMSTVSVFAKGHAGELTGTTESSMTLADGSIETITSDFGTFADKVNEDFRVATKIVDAKGNLKLQVEVASKDKVTAEAVEAAVKNAKSIKKADASAAKEAFDKVFDKMKAADEKFEGKYTAFNFDNAGDFGMNVKITAKVSANVADGTYYLYKMDKDALVECGSITVAANVATVELKTADTYYVANAKLDLAAGEGQAESEEAIEVTTAAEATTTAAEATTTEAAKNPTTGNAPIALAAIPVAIAAAVIVAKKSK